MQELKWDFFEQKEKCSVCGEDCCESVFINTSTKKKVKARDCQQESYMNLPVALKKELMIADTPANDGLYKQIVQNELKKDGL